MNFETGVDRRRQEVRLRPGQAREVQREPHGGAAGLGGRVRADGEGGEGKEEEERRRLRSMICLNLGFGIRLKLDLSVNRLI